MRVCWIVIVAVFLVSLLPAAAEGRAVLSGNTINIWSGSPAVQHEDNCTTLLADIPTKVMSCTSNFASTCISVHASLNITRGSAGNWTNFSVDGCELRMNMTADGSSIMNNWGNFTVISSRITTNSSGRESAIIIKADSNFSMTNSFVSEMGWSDTANRRGLELNSPTFSFSNNTIVRSYTGITLYSGAKGSVLTNITANSNSRYGIYLSSSSSNTFANIAANSNAYHGILLSSSSNNILTNITANSNSYYGIYLYSSSNNNILTNITANSNSYGIYLYYSFNNTLTNITANSNSYFGILLDASSNNNILTNIAANSNSRYGIYLYSSFNNTFSNLNIWRCSTLSADYACIYSVTSENNSFIKGAVNLTRKWLVDIQQSNNTIFQDIQFINTTNIPGGINITNGSMANTFLNSTFLNVTESVSGNSQLIRQWYLDTYANYTNASAAAGANISVWNATGVIMNYSLSNSTGWHPFRLNITQYINDSGTVTYANNHSIMANLSTYTNATISWAIGNGTSGSYPTQAGWYSGDWQGNNTRLAFTLRLLSLPGLPVISNVKVNGIDVLTLSPLNITVRILGSGLDSTSRFSFYKG